MPRFKVTINRAVHEAATVFMNAADMKAAQDKAYNTCTSEIPESKWNVTDVDDGEIYVEQMVKTKVSK